MYYEIFVTTYILSSLFCFIIDLYFPYIRLVSYNKTETIKQYIKMTPLVSLNIILAYPIFYLFKKYYTDIKKNDNYFIINFYIWLVMADFIFYITHRLLHTKQLYFLHSLHHSYRYTFGMGAIYAHPIEFIFNNLGSLTLPIIILGIPYNHLKILLFGSTFITVIFSHGGYIEKQAHLIHHLKYTYNYGIFILYINVPFFEIFYKVIFF